MIENILKPCCYTCKSPDVEVENIDWYYGHGIEGRESKIFCNHMYDCKYYNEDERKLE